MKNIIKKLNNVYENSTLGDIPLIIKELEQEQKHTTITILDRENRQTDTITFTGFMTNKELDLIKLEIDEMWEQVVDEIIDYMDIYKITEKVLQEKGYKVIPTASYQIDI